jgi:hypothetical protein
MSIIGVGTVVTGILIIALSKKIAKARYPPKHALLRPHEDEEKEASAPPFPQDPNRLSFSGQELLSEPAPQVLQEPLLETMRKTDATLLPTVSEYWIGVLAAGFSGILGGSLLAPMHYVPTYEKGLVFLPAFGLSVVAVSPLMMLPYLCIGQRELPPFYLHDTFFVGLLSGFIWSAGNIFAIAAIDRLGYGLAYPLIQTNVLVAGIWGIGLFDEFAKQTGAGAVFTIGAGILLTGAVLLAVGQE